jgi:SAM-dependent methyltransferase
MMLDFFIKLPFNNNFNTSPLTMVQKAFLAKIEHGEYKFKENHCLCGNLDKENDIVISSIDSIGVSINNILCKKCSLIRLEKIFDDSSLSEFYKTDYTELYIGAKYINDEYFKNEIATGSRSCRLFNLVENLGIMDDINNVFEIGCGAGWNLWPYHKSNKNVSGCDYGIDFLKYGIQKGMDLYEGAINKNITSEGTQDLIILSHVFEHIANPITLMHEILSLVKANKYIQIEVPGVFNGKKSVLNTAFQLPHIYTYNKRFFINLFTMFGLEILYIDDEITCILKKPGKWQYCNSAKLEIGALQYEYCRVKKELQRHYFKKKTRYILVKILKLLKLYFKRLKS